MLCQRQPIPSLPRGGNKERQATLRRRVLGHFRASILAAGAYLGQGNGTLTAHLQIADIWFHTVSEAR